MPSFPNIDKSAFRKGEYVGYARGVWRIRKSDERWIASHQESSCTMYLRTLAEISKSLEDFAQNGPRFA